MIADCQETLEATPEFNNAAYTDSCHCKANLEHVISYIGAAATLDTKFQRAVDYAQIIHRNNNPVWWQLSEEARASRHSHNWVTTRMGPFVTKVSLETPSKPRIPKKVNVGLIDAVIQDCEEALMRCHSEAATENLRYTIDTIRSKETTDLQYAEARRWAEIILQNVHAPSTAHNALVTTRMAKFVVA